MDLMGLCSSVWKAGKFCLIQVTETMIIVNDTLNNESSIRKFVNIYKQQIIYRIIKMNRVFV